MYPVLNAGSLTGALRQYLEVRPETPGFREVLGAGSTPAPRPASGESGERNSKSKGLRRRGPARPSQQQNPAGPGGGTLIAHTEGHRKAGELARTIANLPVGPETYSRMELTNRKECADFLTDPDHGHLTLDGLEVQGAALYSEDELPAWKPAHRPLVKPTALLMEPPVEQWNVGTLHAVLFSLSSTTSPPARNAVRPYGARRAAPSAPSAGSTRTNRSSDPAA